MKKGLLVRKMTVLGLAFALLLSTTGCGSSSYDTTSESTVMNSAVDNAGAGMYSESFVEQEMGEKSFQSEEQNTVETNRKLIKTVNMTVETEKYDELVQKLYQKIEILGGYVENFSSFGMDNNRYGNITARIPKANLDAFLETVEGSSNITYRQESVEDVTLNYVDLESHKKMLLKEQERLLELLDMAETIEDIITIESRLTEVQYQIESMESQLRTYDNQIDYSTVYLDIEEVVRYTPQEPRGAWEQIKTGFMENLYSVGDGLRSFFIGLIISIPNLVVFFAVIGILALIVKFIIKWEKKHLAKKAEEKKKVQQAYMQANGMNINMVQQNHNVPQENVQKGADKENE